MTPANRPTLADDPDAKTNPFMFRLELLQNDRVRYASQPIAVVIAETLEAATEGAALLAPRYEAEPARVGLDAGESFVPPAVGLGHPAELHRGDVEAGLAGRRAARSTPPTRPRCSTTTRWSPTPSSPPGTATGCRSTRRPRRCSWRRARFAGLFGIPPDNIHIRSPFLGGGFGSQGPDRPGRRCSASWRRALVGRPVKLVLRREQMFGPVGHRAPTRQTAAHRRRRRRAADRARPPHQGRDLARFDDFFEPAADVSHTLYASAGDRAPRTKRCGVDTGTPLFMRAPGEATGSIALESAIDEMAQACGMDPLAFRLQELCRGRADLRQAVLLEGAARMLRAGRRAFGWERPPARAAPDARRGRAAGRLGRRHGDVPGAHVRRPRRGRCCGATAPASWRPAPHDMGQGAWTALAQIAADALGARRSTRSSSAPAPPTCRMPALRAARATPRPPAWRSITPAPTLIARLADLATTDRAFAALRRRQCRRDRARRPAASPRRREPQRELCRYPRPRRRSREIEGSGKRRRRSRGAGDLRDARARRGVRRGQGRSRSRPDPRHPPGRRLRRRADHQSAAWCAASFSAA